MTSKTSLSVGKEEKPQYDVDEFYGDLCHLVAPLVGMLRLGHAPDMKYAETRLELALALADIALGEGRTTRVTDMDRVRDLRADHGCGYFKNEFDDMKPEIQARYTERLAGIPSPPSAES